MLLKDRLILSVAMVGIFLIAAIYTLFGVGMPMSAFEMTWGEMMPMNMSTHQFMSFKNDKEPVLCEWSIKDGKIIRCEPGATPISS